ncbi:hypothetical protein [Variovorax sp. YR216]|uniref:hypothetical protein n=1 Tax=Variovorax sp. YR216 TaxID=1882828 RepID=UPI0015A1F7C5|nr:hypothetical protein [Variovorax sp. YR216]
MEFDAIYCFDRASVLFPIYPDGPSGRRVIAEISEDALRNLFGAAGGGDSLVQACKEHFDVIEQMAVHLHRRDPHRPLLLATGDFSLPVEFSNVSAA